MCTLTNMIEHFLMEYRKGNVMILFGMVLYAINVNFFDDTSCLYIPLLVVPQLKRRRPLQHIVINKDKKIFPFVMTYSNVIVLLRQYFIGGVYWKYMYNTKWFIL